MLTEHSALQLSLELFCPRSAIPSAVDSLAITAFAENNHASINRTDSTHIEDLVEVELEVTSIDSSGGAGRSNVFLFVDGKVFKHCAHEALQ